MSPMWATVRKLLPLALTVNIVLVMLDRLSIGSAAAGLLDTVSGAAVSVVAGYVARDTGAGRMQPIRAAWWLGVCGVGLNWLEHVFQLRPSTPFVPMSMPPGVSPVINLADPNVIATLLNVFVVVGLLVALLGVIVVAPFALLGHWAAGDPHAVN